MRALINTISRLDLPRGFNNRSALGSYLGYSGARVDLEGATKEDVIRTLSEHIGEAPPAPASPPTTPEEAMDRYLANLNWSQTNRGAWLEEARRISGQYMGEERYRRYLIRKAVEILQGLNDWGQILGLIYSTFTPFSEAGWDFKKYFQTNRDIRRAVARKVSELGIPRFSDGDRHRNCNFVLYYFDVNLQDPRTRAVKSADEIIAELQARA
jgi:hypothetical protein